MIVVTVAAAGLIVATQPAARADHRPHEWCPGQESSWCINIHRDHENRRAFWTWHDGGNLRRIVICVRPPEGSAACHRFRLFGGDTFRNRDVVWREHYPNEGPGAYTVIWRKLDGTMVGRPLGFHVD